MYAHDLQCADALLAGQHQVDDLEPVAERLVGVLEDRSDQTRRTDSRQPWRTWLHCQWKGRLVTRINVNIPASRAMDAFGPAAR